MTKTNLFNKAGMAAISDLHSEHYKDIFTHLESEQKIFLSHESHFRSANYKWPKDPLHCWSRVWEYPYVYYHLQKIKNLNPSDQKLKVVDFGSGVTFFPFAVAKMGIDVQCLDIDPVCATDILSATNVVDIGPGKVSFSLIEDDKLPVQKNQIDVVYCISVLEHIDNFESTIEQIVEILKPNGILILTIDLDLCGYLDISNERYLNLRESLLKHFEFLEVEETTHPIDILTQSLEISWGAKAKYACKEFIRSVVKNSKFRKYPNLAVWAAVLRKK